MPSTICTHKRIYAGTSYIGTTGGIPARYAHLDRDVPMYNTGTDNFEMGDKPLRSRIMSLHPKALFGNCRNNTARFSVLGTIKPQEYAF